MAMIDVQNLTFAYDGTYDTIFEEVSFRIDTDWKLGFTGRNGRGKTTFLRLLLGELDSGGSILSPVSFDYFPFSVPDPQQETLELLHGIAPSAEDWEIFRELSLLHVDADVLYRPFHTLSNGEQTKVLLSALFLKEENFLLIDEPTNHLDLEGRETVAGYLKRKKGFILVSHDRAFLDACIDHVLSINRKDIVIRKGNFSSWLQEKERQDQLEIQQNRQLKQEIGRLAESAKRTDSWSRQVEKTKKGSFDSGYIGHKAAKMMKHSQVTLARKEKAIEEKSKLMKNLELDEVLRLHPLSYHGKRLAEARDLSIGWNGQSLFSPLSFSILQGQRISLQGPNGSGKSSLFKLFLGESIPHTGSLTLSSGLRISYTPQDPSFLSGPLSEFEAQRQLDIPLFRSILRKMDFSRLQFEKPMETYSAGQKKKVLLAASLSTPAHLYLWDEPLNYVDVLSRIQIENLLMECPVSLLFVEHDRTFSEKVATDIIRLQKYA